MNRRSAWWWACLLLASALLAPPHGLARPKPQATPGTGLRAVMFGVRPPDFAYNVGNGPALLSQRYGQPVVINFWATWCEPCRDELPAFENLMHEYGSRATLITLSAERPGLARTFLKQHGFAPLPVAEDPDRLIFDTYTIGPIPVTIILNPNGAVAHVAVGELDWKELAGAVDAALALEAPPATPAARAATDR